MRKLGGGECVGPPWNYPRKIAQKESRWKNTQTDRNDKYKCTKYWWLSSNATKNLIKGQTQSAGEQRQLIDDLIEQKLCQWLEIERTVVIIGKTAVHGILEENRYDADPRTGDGSISFPDNWRLVVRLYSPCRTSLNKTKPRSSATAVKWWRFTWKFDLAVRKWTQLFVCYC